MNEWKIGDEFIAESNCLWEMLNDYKKLEGKILTIEEIEYDRNYPNDSKIYFDMNRQNGERMYFFLFEIKKPYQTIRLKFKDSEDIVLKCLSDTVAFDEDNDEIIIKGNQLEKELSPKVWYNYKED